MENPVISIKDLNKRYAGGFKALDDINLEIKKSEIFALLGPNGAGKTTLINIICGIVTPSSGSVTVDRADIIKKYRESRSKIGLVPQELTTDMFEPVIDTVNFSRSLFGKPNNPAFIEKILKDLSLWGKRNNKILTLSGGMKRRVLIAKALSHEPEIPFLDEPTAGVDVELRREMREMVRKLRETGVTIILTTHYIEEAQEMADRIGIINKGKIILVDEKNALMNKLGKKELFINLKEELDADLGDLQLEVSRDRRQLIYHFDSTAEDSGIQEILNALTSRGIGYKDLQTKKSTLEEIFVELVGAPHEL